MNKVCIEAHIRRKKTAIIRIKWVWQDDDFEALVKSELRNNLTRNRPKIRDEKWKIGGLPYSK